MKWLKLLPDINFKDPITGKSITVQGRGSWSHYEWLMHQVIYDPAFGKGVAVDRARVELPRSVLKAMENGKIGVPVENAWGTMMANAINNPHLTNNPIVSVQCLPFQEITLDLFDEEPFLDEKVPANGESVDAVAVESGSP